MKAAKGCVSAKRGWHGRAWPAPGTRQTPRCADARAPACDARQQRHAYWMGSTMEAEEASTPLRRNRGFLLLLLGQSVSFLGSNVTSWALPLTAVLALGASA